MRLGLIGSNHVSDLQYVYENIDKFLTEFSIKHPVFVLRDYGAFSEKVVKYLYFRGWDVVALPYQNLKDIDAYNQNVDKVISFVDEEDKQLMTSLKRLRKKGSPVIYHGSRR